MKSFRVQHWVIGAGLLTALACGGGGTGRGTGGFGVVPYVINANVPTQIRFAPDGRLFYTELATGQVRVVTNAGLLPTAFATLPVATSGEQGLLGLAFDPDFSTNHFVYVFFTNANPLKQEVVRFDATNNVGTNMTVIVDNIPASSHHDGGRIGFGTDGKLYVTVGDNEDPANAQNDNVLPGKILRYNADGTIPLDNPISGNPLYVKGVRNSFGMTFHPTSGRLYFSENGPTCDDEVNYGVPGGNYGWRPSYPCGDTDASYIAPLFRYTSTIAPTGLGFYTGSEIPELQGLLLMGSFNGGTLRSFVVDDSVTPPVVEERGIILSGRPGGILDVTTGPDGFPYICDSSGIFRVVKS